MTVLGLILLLYALTVVLLTTKKPYIFWNMGKTRFFIRILGEKGTEIFFYFIAILAAVFGILLLLK